MPESLPALPAPVSVGRRLSFLAAAHPANGFNGGLAGDAFVPHAHKRSQNSVRPTAKPTPAATVSHSRTF